MVGALGNLEARADTMIAKILWRISLLAVCILALMNPEVASAQAGSTPQAGDRAKNEARRHFDLGLVLARSRNWDGALAEFLTSRELFPTRSATRNAALALRELGRFSDALYLYDALLEDFRETIPHDELETFRSERRALLERVGELLLVVEQTGVTVSVDGRERGATPSNSALYLEPGAHQLRLSKPGLESLERQVSVPSGRREVLVMKLEQGMAAVVVGTIVPGARVYVDGVFLGPGPWQGRLPAGSHRFEVLAPGREPFRENLVLAPSGQTELAVTLKLLADSGHVPPGKEPRFYVEPQLGALLGRSLGGGAACGCVQRAHPFGLVGLLRAGHYLSDQLAVEIAAGYLNLGERATRPMVATGERGSSPFVSRDFRDSTRLDGPLATVGWSARFFSNFPLTARISGGVAVLRSRTAGAGTFVGELEAGHASSTRVGTLQIAEPQHLTAAPIFASELRVGRRLASRISADIGLALYLVLPPRVLRGQRVGVLNGEASSGAFTLPDELLAGPFLSLSPAISARLSF